MGRKPRRGRLNARRGSYQMKKTGVGTLKTQCTILKVRGESPSNREGQKEGSRQKLLAFDEVIINPNGWTDITNPR